MRKLDRRRVVALAYDGLCTFEFGIVVEIFGLPRPEFGASWYRFQVCSLDRGPLKATGGVTIRAQAGLSALRGAGTIVIPGWRDASERPPKALLGALRAAHAAGARLATICSCKTSKKRKSIKMHWSTSKYSIIIPSATKCSVRA